MRVNSTLARVNNAIIRRLWLEKLSLPQGSITYNTTPDLLGTPESTNNSDMQRLARGDSDFNIQLRRDVRLFNPFTISDRSVFIYGGIQSIMTMKSIAIVRAGPSLYDYFKGESESDIEEFYMISLSREQLRDDQVMDMVVTYLNKIAIITNGCIHYETTLEYIDAIIGDITPIMKYGINRRVFRFHLRIFDSITTLMMTFELPYHQIATATDDRVFCTTEAKSSIESRSISGIYSSSAIEQARLDEFNVANTTIGNDWISLFDIDHSNIQYYDTNNHNLIQLINRLSDVNMKQLTDMITREVHSISQEYNIDLVPYYYGLVLDYRTNDEAITNVKDMIEWLKRFINILTTERYKLLESHIFDYRWYNISFYNHKYVYNWRIEQGTSLTR